MSNGDTRFVAPSTSRLRVMRDGHNIIRSARIPKPVVLVDTRERQPFPLHVNHPNWIGGERRVALKTGDYTVEGMENLLCLERKNLADLVACTVTYRRRFLAVCARLARFPWKAILVEATLEDIKVGASSRSTSRPTSIPMPSAASWTRSKRSSASPSSTRPPCRTSRRSAPRAGSPSTSPTGGWSSRASAGC